MHELDIYMYGWMDGWMDFLKEHRKDKGYIVPYYTPLRAHRDEGDVGTIHIICTCLVVFVLVLH